MRIQIQHFLFALTLITLSGCASKAAIEQDQALIDEVMRQRKADFDSCYKLAKKENPELQGGVLVMRFEHSTDGRLIAPRTMKRFLGSAPVETCIEQSLARVQTERPRTRGPVDLEWSFEKVASSDVDRQN